MADQPSGGGPESESNVRAMFDNRSKQFAHRTRYRLVTPLNTVLEGIGSNNRLSSAAGSNLVFDSPKILSLQEDARSRKISSEIMKRGLYKSATGSYKRRIYNLQSDPSMEDSRFRMYRSLPGTPMRSIEGTPSHSPTHSPTTNRRRSVFEFQSRGPTPLSYTSPVSIEDEVFAEERSCQGLASIFKPQPRYIRANTSRSKNSFDNWDKLSEERELMDDLAIGDIQLVVIPGSG